MTLCLTLCAIISEVKGKKDPTMVPQSVCWNRLASLFNSFGTLVLSVVPQMTDYTQSPESRDDVVSFIRGFLELVKRRLAVSNRLIIPAGINSDIVENVEQVASQIQTLLYHYWPTG